ncbi:immunoglobulin superfamily DCC subclass member 3-like isoform X3 [Saccostrea cucullata]|uniref:immunoglobulin superfamily DCC subclass member 3-like isoform X3 n=1 Tax=Saccostrea cuccullata TaxID=36930 RepID=UPI002ED31457
MESPVICLIFLCVRDEALFCKGAELINLPPVITSEFEPEYFVPIFYSTPLSLFCSAKYNVLRYQWHKNYSKIVENDRVSYNPSTGEIIFRNLEKEDFGVYYCTAQNKFGISVSLFVKLSEADSSTSILTEAVYQSGDRVFVGENATLLCIFSGNPAPKIEWQNKNGIYITTNDKYIVGQYGRRLQIINVTFADEGFYECKTNNNLIQNPFLNVTSPPLFPDVGKRFMTKIMQNSTTVSIVLQCNAMSATAEIDPIVIKWMKNEEILNEDVRYQLSGDKKTLHIYNKNSDNSGCYTCVIENSEGIAVANFLLPYGVKRPYGCTVCKFRPRMATERKW